jgi:uncharacterized protein
MRINLLTWLFFCLWLSPIMGQADDFPPRMNPPRMVNDYAGLLSTQQANALEHKLRSYRDTTSNEVAIVIIRSTGMYDISQYGAELGQKWGIGKKGKDNGILILVASNDRKVNISTGYGLESRVTDAASKRIIEDYIIPSFRQQKYFEGLDQATTLIIGLAQGEFSADKITGQEQGQEGAIAFIIILLLFFVIFPMMRKRSVQKAHYGTRPIDVMTAMMLMGSHRGRGSYQDFSSGRGGFGGFGGGSFGGGGASGSW